MALDAAAVSALGRELKNELAGCKIDKINMPSKEEAVFALFGASGRKTLLISARSGASRVHITKESFEKPAAPFSFCMLLRKHLQGGRFVGIEQPNGDRILILRFESLNEMGDLENVGLSVEMMGRYSNLVLLDGNDRIIDALKRISLENSGERPLLAGLEFTLPALQNKRSVFGMSAGDIADCAIPGKRLSQCIMDSVAGLGPALCREIAYRAVGDVDAADVPYAQAVKAAGEIVAAIDAPNGAYMTLEQGRPVEFSLLPLTQYEGCEQRRFDTLGELLDEYYSARDAELRAAAMSDGLRKTVKKLLDRAVKRRRTRTEELARSENADEARVFGELITANLHMIERGASSACLLDYTSGKTVEVRLDPSKSAVDNAQRYFKQYKKAKRAREYLTNLLAAGEREEEYLNTVLFSVSAARSFAEFEEIRAELVDAGYMRRRTGAKRQKPLGFLKYKTSDGFTVLAGRNNAQNERLSLKTADKNDWWFHVKNAAGSHVVLRLEGREATLEAMNEAAALAALCSELKGVNGAAVDYTRIKELRKTRDLPTGMVLYENYRTAYVPENSTLPQKDG